MEGLGGRNNLEFVDAPPAGRKSSQPRRDCLQFRPKLRTGRDHGNSPTTLQESQKSLRCPNRPAPAWAPACRTSAREHSTFYRRALDFLPSS